MKNEILQNLGNVIGALNNVQVTPGKENYLNQGGAIAMLEGIYDKIMNCLIDKEEQKEESNEPPTDE